MLWSPRLTLTPESRLCLQCGAHPLIGQHASANWSYTKVAPAKDIKPEMAAAIALLQGTCSLIMVHGLRTITGPTQVPPLRVRKSAYHRP